MEYVIGTITPNNGDLQNMGAVRKDLEHVKNISRLTESDTSVTTLY